MRKIASTLGSLVLASSLSAPALAQQDEATAKPPAAETFALEEVIVTATKRKESLQDVAVSVSAFTGEFFRDSGITDLRQLQQYTPSLKITPGASSNDASIRIRGIGSVGSNSGIDPSVGMFIDGVYQGRAGMSLGDLIDIERVEVLRGPQGTLYGKNTAAGAISIITQRPGPEFEGKTELVYDSNNLAQLRGTVNVPFGDSGHAMRVTGYGIVGDHLYTNSWNGEGINDANKWGLKTRFLFNTEAAGEWLLSVDYGAENTDCCALAVIDYYGLSTLNAPSTNTPSRQWQQALGLNAQGQPILDYSAFEDTQGFSPPQADPFADDGYWFNSPIENKVDVGGVALEWNYDLPKELGLTFINAWRQYNSENSVDGDFTAYDAVTNSTDINLNQYSSELRITSPGGQTLDWIGGLYAYYSELDSVGEFGLSNTLTNQIPLFGNFFPDGTQNTDSNVYKTTSYAAFGQVVWNITDKFSAMLGLRYTYEKKQREGSQITDPASILDLPPIAGPNIYYDDSRADSDISPAFNLRYFLQPEVMLYGSISRGFKSGGYDQRRQALGESGEFDEETATNYEIGWKGAWFDNRVRINGTFYFIDYEDFQSQTFDGTSLKVTNAGSLQSYGSELEAVWAAMTDMTLGTAIGYNKAEYKEFDGGQCTVDQSFYEFYVIDGNESGAFPGVANPPCTQDLAGEPLDNAPVWTVSSYLQYETAFTASLLGIVRLEHNFIDTFFLDQDLDPKLENDAVNLINLRLSLATMQDSWEVSLWGRNLLDEQYYSFGIDIPVLGGYAGVVAPQRTYGLTLRYNF
jgi:iron complex outermembrane receptor protein